ncbi:hypothetical protein [Pleurocapsa sp. PCC 7319]|uniref:hypothetical protein n=1 Tax=Pleurocapsa sp. PCC 7319 TaxID=118161 RepID=UPI0011818F57|nr:hypothetical protein [Pleurocapsa sp. PCC 7319]
MTMSYKIQSNIGNMLTWTTTGLFLIGGVFLFTRPALSQPKTQFLLAQNSPSLKAESAQQETLYLNNDRTYSYNLIAQERGVIDNVTVPVGATIVGKYVPAEGGLRYVAEAVTYGNYSYRINASSGIIKDVKDPRDTSAGAIAKDAGIGAAGGVVLGEVFGDAGVGEIVGGAAAGAATGNLTADRVVVIEPDSAISLYE